MCPVYYAFYSFKTYSFLEKGSRIMEAIFYSYDGILLKSQSTASSFKT